MKKSTKSIIIILIAIAVIVMGIGIGSVFISPFNILLIFLNKLFNLSLPEGFDSVHAGLVWNMRLPRVILAFLVGAALSVSGTVMQSVLKNPLASSYGLGVSSGAGLGAALVMITGLSSGVSGIFLLPLTGLLFGLAAVFIAIILASAIDKHMSNNTIILTGMVISLFINAIMTSLAAASPQYSQRILLWQLGSFSMKEWSFVAILFPVVLFGIFFFMKYARELDIMTFGEEQANALGVDLRKVKWIFMGVSALLTGTAVAFVGIIGFVDLIAPHIVRRFFGSSHRYVVPVSALFGGAFMVASDLIARTCASPSEIPIGAVTALVGAPFFIYVYFKTRKKV
jgi:iron complex transport system permease protein